MGRGGAQQQVQGLFRQQGETFDVLPDAAGQTPLPALFQEDDLAAGEAEDRDLMAFLQTLNLLSAKNQHGFRLAFLFAQPVGLVRGCDQHSFLLALYQRRFAAAD